MNYLELQEILNLFKTKVKLTTELKVGDIIIDEFGWLLVGQLEKQPSGWSVLDHFDSGMVMVDDNKEWNLIDSDFVDPEALQSLCEFRTNSAN